MSAFRSDHLLVRDYVTAMDHLQYTQLPEGVVAILLTHSNLTANHLDIRLDLHMTIEEVKEKFRTHIGTPVQYQRLLLKNAGEIICELSDNTKMLGFYSVVSGNEIQVIDTDPFSLSRGGGLTDVSLVEKYQMSDDKYDKRDNTIRQFIKEKRKKDPNFKLNAVEPKTTCSTTTTQKSEDFGVKSVEGIEINMRCEVTPAARRGTVKFVGEVPNVKSDGYWVGVQFDEPVGMSDGSVKGQKVFDCLKGYGSFVRGKNVKVGDYPELDIFNDDEDTEKNDKNGEKEENQIAEDEDEI